jgi:phosphoglycolate phosphatase
MIKAVLFDLDGTLADTASDLAYALNRVRSARGLAPLPLAATRPFTSHGARGLLGVGFNIQPGDPDYDALREEFLAIYADNLCRETRIFAGMPELLVALQARGLPWGVVTNKQERFTLPLLEKLGVRDRAACVIGGDTTGQNKPHPEPLLAASRAIGVAPDSCVYVGDDRRDVEAGRAAGMKIAVAGWGYLNGGEAESWNADWLLKNPQELLRIL